jgi:hypothetical protein
MAELKAVMEKSAHGLGAETAKPGRPGTRGAAVAGVAG